jgi:hypothetical protein
MSNSDIEQTGTVKGHIYNVVSLSGNISIGSVAGDFIIKMTIEVNGDNYTVTSCDKTMEQIDAAVASGQNIKAIAFDKYVMPLVQMEYSESYTFGAFIGSFLIAANVYKNPESGTDDWQFYLSPITADIVEYSNAVMPRISTVSEALDKLVPNSHTHSNKSVLDKFTETDGKPTYDGKKISGASTAEEVEYTNAILPDASNVKSALDDTIDTQQTQSADLESLRSGVNALMDAYETQGGDIASLKTQAHTHSNKSVLDKFAESDGKPTYNGEALGGGTSDFIIKMTIESHDDGNYYTVTSCDTTIEQIDAAVAAEKRVVLIATDTATGMFWELPIVQAVQGATYIFIAFTYSGYIIATVYKSGENEIWEYMNGGISAESVSYYNSTQQDVESVMAALNKLFTNSHTHSNKDTLDKISVLNGKLQYNGSDVGLKPVKGTDYWTAADKTEIVNDTLAALPTWTGGNY